jgi:hypothetical protein
MAWKHVFEKKRYHPKEDIIIDWENISINDTIYKRSHVTGWTVRWTEITQNIGGTQNIGSILAMKHIANAALQSYYITFDYGNKNVVALKGLTEASSGRLMEAIQASLGKV